MITESRIQILDRLSKKWGQKTNPLVENFDDFCICFDHKAITQLVYIAMREYENQWFEKRKKNKRHHYDKDRIEEMMIETMKDKWSHCWVGEKLCQRPKGFEDELAMKMEGAKIMLEKICWLKSDRKETDDMFPFLKEE